MKPDTVHSFVQLPFVQRGSVSCHVAVKLGGEIFVFLHLSAAHVIQKAADYEALSAAVFNQNIPVSISWCVAERTWTISSSFSLSLYL